MECWKRSRILSATAAALAGIFSPGNDAKVGNDSSCIYFFNFNDGKYFLLCTCRCSLIAPRLFDHQQVHVAFGYVPRAAAAEGPAQADESFQVRDPPNEVGGPDDIRHHDGRHDRLPGVADVTEVSHGEEIF